MLACWFWDGFVAVDGLALPPPAEDPTLALIGWTQKVMTPSWYSAGT